MAVNTATVIVCVVIQDSAGVEEQSVAVVYPTTVIIGTIIGNHAVIEVHITATTYVNATAVRVSVIAGDSTVGDACWAAAATVTVDATTISAGVIVRDNTGVNRCIIRGIQTAAIGSRVIGDVAVDDGQLVAATTVNSTAVAASRIAGKIAIADVQCCTAVIDSTATAFSAVVIKNTVVDCYGRIRPTTPDTTTTPIGVIAGKGAVADG